jgi:tyrosyl-tRNA synthetase
MGQAADFLHIARERGFFHQCTDETGLAALLGKGVVTAYTGYDCTGPSLHVGHLLPMLLQRWFQKCGHKPIVVMGGGTTKVGDPSGKDETRQLMSDETIAANMASIKAAFARLVTFGTGPSDALMVNNADWLGRLEYIPFLRDVGRHFTINRMLTFDSVKLRLEREQPLTFLEFNYMILQAYDFLELERRHGCLLQCGGSDQWGNIVSGVDLIRRIDAKEAFGLTIPLLTTSSGAKMGKTAAGAVWLNADQLPAFDFWQYWRNTEDADVGRFLKLFTELPLAEIARLEALGGAEINEAKKVLATEVTALVRGREEAARAAEGARQTFELREMSDALPTTHLPRDQVIGAPAFILAHRAGLTNSGSEARRQADGGGLRVNGEKVGADRIIADSDLRNVSGAPAVQLSLGRKQHVLVRPV